MAFKQENFKKGRLILLGFLMICTLILGPVIYRTIVFEHLITGSSMEPTVMSYSYGCSEGILRVDEWHRGDIVVLKYEHDDKMYLFKRIIGLPGETLELRRGSDGFEEVWINGTHLEEPYIELKTKDTDETRVFKIPEDTYMVMGDNRIISFDSRNMDQPFIAKKDLVARFISVKEKGSCALTVFGSHESNALEKAVHK